MATIYLASGCFWGREYHFRKLPGVINTRTGFMGGDFPDPTYQQVCTKDTGHAETVEVLYDITELTTRELLTEFFLLHDFTQDRREDGGQYRSAIFISPTGEGAVEQQTVAREMIALLDQNGLSPATEIRLEDKFYVAAERHQQYCSTQGFIPKKHENEEVSRILTL